ncbi:MAG: hypothetical protein JXR21_00820 [Candidatus Marinimicrobia bacterium]|nr:hypothetical protein [Candidatus Neomarinimicrobiota bacterium]
MPKPSENKIFHVISNTHWDREWRFPFQKNRQHLVAMIDSVLEILENDPDYRAFHLDSQSIVLHDYLEIRPQKRALIERFVREKRLFIGPWYILPDEFMVSGENLIRNLLLGHETCRSFGRVSKVGYSPFSWGQISQLPQIYAGFGIDLIMFYRGVNSLDSPKAEFRWIGADGTEALASRFSTMPRYNFYFFIYRPVLFDETPADIEYGWDRGGAPFHFADIGLYHEDYSLLKPEATYYEKNVVAWTQKLIDEQLDDFTTPHVIWMEGHDSSGPNPLTTKILRDIRRLMPDADVRHSTLEDYAKALKKDADLEKLKIVKGERRSAQADARSGNLYGYITSARMYLKQMNTDCERWLERYAEPAYTLAGILGHDISDDSLRIAWRMLLENAAHDSIGGCSLDSIHEDMVNRYKQVREIAQSVFEKACKYLISNTNCPGNSPNDIHLSILNTTQFLRSETVEAHVDIPLSFDRGSLRILDRNGRELPCKILSRAPSEPVLEQLTDRPMYYAMMRYHVLLHFCDLSPFSISTFHVHPEEGSVPAAGHAIVRAARLENDVLSVEVNPDGTLNILHKASGKILDHVGCFEDEGEAGHAWVHEKRGPVFTTRNMPAVIHVLRDNELQQQVRVIHRMPMPGDLKERMQGIASKNMKIDTLITLNKNSQYVEYQVNIDNLSEDHRVRILFDTGRVCEHSYAEGQFDIVKRGTDRPDTSDWIEQPMYDHPLYHFADLRDREGGSAIFVDGLKEYEVLPDRRTLGLTLFRAFRYVIQPSSKQDYAGQKGSQCLGSQQARFAFCPYDGTLSLMQVNAAALTYNTPLRLMQHGNTQGSLDPGTSYIRLSNDRVVVSCLKETQDRVKDTYILRLYNPTEETQRTTLTLDLPIKKAERTDLEENALNMIPLKDKQMNLTLEAKKILTIRLYR